MEHDFHWHFFVRQHSKSSAVSHVRGGPSLRRVPSCISTPCVVRIFHQSCDVLAQNQSKRVTRVRQPCTSKATRVFDASLFSRLRNLRTTIIGAISSAELVRNLGALTRAMFLQDDQRPSPPESRVGRERGKSSARSKRFLESLDSRLREIEERNAAWLALAEAQEIVASVEQAAHQNQNQNPGKGKPSTNGSPKSDISSWCAKRAFSDQFGKGGFSSTRPSLPRKDKLLAIVNKTSISKQRDKLGALAQNVHHAGPASSGDRGVRLVHGQEHCEATC